MKHEIIQQYAELVEAKTAITEAKNLPERFRAAIDFQANLTAFVIRNPNVLRLGVERSIALDDAGASAVLDAEMRTLQ